MQEPNDWIVWHGGNCPVNFDEKVDVILRSGKPIIDISANLVRWIHCPADQKFITHVGFYSDDDVIKYRVSNENLNG